jgi:hypothetical protein
MSSKERKLKLGEAQRFAFCNFFYYQVIFWANNALLCDASACQVLGVIFDPKNFCVNSCILKGIPCVKKTFLQFLLRPHLA